MKTLRSHPHLLFVVIACTVLSVGSAIAQESRFPVADLVDPPDLPAAHGGLPWLDRFGHEDESENLVRWIVGEHELLGREEEPSDLSGYFSGHDLRELVAHFAKLDAQELSIENGVLITPASAANDVRAVLDWLRANLPPRLEVDVRLERVAGGETETLLSGAQTFVAGETVVFADVRRQQILYDFNVEIAQAAATADPVQAQVSTGASIAFRARPMITADACVVEAVVRAADPGPEESIQTRNQGFGDLDRMAVGMGEAGTTFVVPRNGRTVHEWTDAAGRGLRLSCTARWEVGSGAQRDDAVMWSSALLNGPIHSFSTARFSYGKPDARFGDGFMDTVAAALERVDADEVVAFDAGIDRPAGALVLTGNSARLARAEGTGIAQIIARALTPVDVSVWILDVPAGQAVGALDPDGRPPEGSRVIARVAGPVLAGHGSCFAGLAERSYLRDWDVEVAQSSRIPDPKVALLEDGYALNLLVTLDGQGNPSVVGLDCELSAIDGLVARETPINSEIRTAGSTSASGSGEHVRVSTMPPMLMPQDIVRIEQARTRSHRITTTARLDDGGSALIRRTARTFTGPGRELVVLVRAQRPR